MCIDTYESQSKCKELPVFRALVAFTGMSFLVFPSMANPTPTVSAIVETVPVGVEGDAADDAAIITGATPYDTRIVGTQKKGGLYVYDLKGRIVQEAMGGRPNNVDARPGFAWPEGRGHIIVTSDRVDNSIRVYRFDDASKRLDPVARSVVATGFQEVYGVAIGRLGEAFVVVATDKDGDVAQWSLTMKDGQVVAQETRRFALGSIAEGAVIDDELGNLFVSQEMEGLWRFPLDPAQGDKGSYVDRVAPNGNLVEDVEGVTIWAGSRGAGYLIVSAQGDSRFNVHDRAAPFAFRGSFRVVDNAARTIDGVSETDGVEVSSMAMGPRFPRGLLVVQDGDNTLPAETQNFKYVSWADVEKALGLAP